MENENHPYLIPSPNPKVIKNKNGILCTTFCNDLYLLS